jgi:hypothetical protein
MDSSTSRKLHPFCRNPHHFSISDMLSFIRPRLRL